MVLFICFIIIKNKPIPVQNFETFSFPEGTTEFVYEFLEPTTLQDGKDGYFFFKFSDRYYYITLTIKDEDNKEIIIKPKSKEIYYKYKIENMKPQKFIFNVTNTYWYSEKIVFIDNSKEINIKFQNLFTLNFDTEEIEGKPPLPIIFNLESFEENIYILFDTNSESGNIYDGKAKLEYCEIVENECSFKGNNSNLFLEKGKKYKIKYNCNEKNSNIYSFNNYKISNAIREIDIGYHKFSLDTNFREFYFILNVKNYEKFYIYNHQNYFYFNYAFINKDEKKEFVENKISFNSLDYNRENPDTIIGMNKEKDYLLIRIEYYINPEEGFLYFYSLMKYIGSDETFEIEKGQYALIQKFNDYNNREKYILVSSNKSMGMLNLNLNEKSLTNILFLDDYRTNFLIFVDSSKEKTNFKYYAYSQSEYDVINLNLLFEKNITVILNLLGSDSLFSRSTSNDEDFIYGYMYFFDFEESYYLYYKKCYGIFDIYKYNKELNWFSNIVPFIDSNYFSKNLDEYDLINNKLIIVSGYQLFCYFNSYGSLYDSYFQKVNDLEHIQINSGMGQYNNLVKLLKENKLYYLDFNVDHLIKLDKDFLEAEVTFTDSNNIIHILNKKKKVIRDLKGEGIVVKANKKALIYFYKKMDNITEKGMIEFNISKIGKNMKFNITSKKKSNYINIFIAEDFGFKGYYPMLSNESFIQINARRYTSTIYVDNLYDKLEKNELYEDEGEKYYIYIFDSENDYMPIFNSEDYILSELVYFDDLLYPINKNNFYIIPGHSNGSIILNAINKQKLEYQFFTCKNNEIKFKIESSNGHFNYQSYPYEEIVEENKENYYYLYQDQTLSLSFESSNEFLFSFLLNNGNSLHYCYSNDDLKIMSIYEISKNIVQVKFIPKYQNCESHYYIIIAKKDELNNKDSFSDPCYSLKLLNENKKNSILIKPIFEKNQNLIIDIVDISQLNALDNSELIATIINYKNTFELYQPFEFLLKKKEAKEFKLGEVIEFDFDNNNFFKFEYKQENDLPQEIYFSFDSYYDFTLYLSNNNKTIIYEYDEDNAEIKKYLLKKQVHII